VNASEQAKSLDITTKIATVVNIFKSQFPDAKADLNPWRNDPDTQNFLDPDSIDIGFHFPGWSRRSQCRSILVQIRFHQDPFDLQSRLIGIESAGFSHTGQAWRLSTINNWEFSGDSIPSPDVGEKLRNFCRQVFELFTK
jgi:hypothetical protein